MIRDEYSPYKIVHHLDRIQELKEGKQPAPLQVQIVPANKCNQRCSFCFPGDALVRTEDGFCEIKDIEEGIGVFDFEGNLKTVTNTMSRQYDGDLISFRFSRFDVDFKCTPEHPIFIKDKGYIDAGKVVVGDFVRFPKISTPSISSLKISDIVPNLIEDENGFVKFSNGKKSVKNNIAVDESFGRLCGYFLSEGHCSFSSNRPNSGNVVFTFSIKETDYLEDVTKLTYDIFGIDVATSFIDPTVQITLHSNVIAKLFYALFNTGSSVKDINPALNGCSEEFLKGLLDGYFSGDGCFSDHSFSTVSLPLVLSILSISFRLGLSPNVYCHRNHTGHYIGTRLVKNSGYSYTVKYRGDDKTIYDRIVGNDSKIGRRVNWKSHLVDDLGVYFSVKDIKSEPYNGVVYNISVDDTESYTVNGISVHNCAYRMADYNSNQLFNDGEILSYEKIIESLDCFVEMGVKAVQYTGGGEPLVHPRIKDIFRETKKRGLEFSLVTNGMALDDELCDILADASWVRISVDSGNADTYSLIRQVSHKMYDKTINNITNLVSKNRTAVIGVGFVVNRENYNEILEAANTFKKIGVNNFRISAAFTPMGYKYFDTFLEDAMNLSKEAEKLSTDTFTVFNLFNDRVKDTFEGTQDYHKCPVKDLLSYIGADYNVYTCCTLAYNERGKIGSIKDQSFKELWESTEKIKMFDEHDPCINCQHPCMYKGKNEFINYCTKTDAKHINYI